MANEKSINKFLGWLLFVAVMSLAFVFTSTARADNGPHSGFGPVTDACAGCHRAHTGQGGYLLLSTGTALCESCHGTPGTGADTNVWDGVYVERDGVTEAPAEGVAGRGLRGGGFANALIDSYLDDTASSAASTSAHTFDGSSGTMWGNGAIGSGPGGSLALGCTNCHNPHGRAGTGGTATYRILRAVPTGSGGSGVEISDEITKIYTVADANNNYMQESYGFLASPLTNWCSQCHTRYRAPGDSGHTDSGDPIFAYRHSTVNVSCVKCHVSHGSSAPMGPSSGAVRWPDGSAEPNGDARSSLLRLANRGVCAHCHVTPDGSVGGGCDMCHGAPPTSGAHQEHAGPNSVGYGLTGSYATDTGYEYGCGECHPTDLEQHQNGAVDVLLSPTGAPGGSLKAKNAPSAAYSGGSCGGVYCHSGLQVTSGVVGTPLTDTAGNPILDLHGNLTYDPYTVTHGRTFQATPPWVGGTIGTCTACHTFPLTTSYPAVQAGVGDTHQWIDNNGGYGNLHAWNMSFAPIACRTCHYGEITTAGTWSRNASDITTYDPVPLASLALHANGQPDVSFDTVNLVVYPTYSGTRTYSLASATYNPAEKSCSNVGCHKSQTYVRWGTPYRWWYDAECDLCHRYYLPPPPSLTTTTTPVESSAIHANMETLNCKACHTRPHGGG